MKIRYLNKLKNAPTRPDLMTNEGISENEIIQLESSFNNGMMFPKALRELLYLAGDFCYVCDFGLTDTQEELQLFVRGNIDYYNKSIVRPFYVFDIYNAREQFLFIYLDEGDNPPIYAAQYCKLPQK
ncbi:hypothetical protein CHU92_01170 [Flavobacterium cyanobacteriorum]|uniref:Knr4/Smi1-like domain-containing protein n=1 Tax=Flavobacterium cyanobacteriorum TaxID=2022802 RepID=A0A256A208_9FLAO|nr:hypothetical protein [Flavobacterium cyanobacteriorum]OYQ47155.1 hypothetical protein CHU92_01170 [Flavobacterium cyanobacteriorum]